MNLFAPREKPLVSPFAYALIVAGAVVVALLIGALLMVIWGANPLDGYRELLLGIIGSKHSIAESLLKATPLVIISLGIAVAFSASVWNIGAEGQFYMGALFGTWVAVAFTDLPGYLLWPLTLLAATLAGALWGGFVGYLRARLSINEIIVTVMMNYIAAFFVQYMLASPLRETKSLGVGYPQTDAIPQSIWLPRILPGTRLHLGFIIALLLVVIVYFLLKHTTLGYSLRAVGKNPVAAKWAGIDVGRMTVIAMAISGGLAGFAGQIEVTGVHHRLLYGISSGYGFIAIVVTLLGNQNPFGILIAGVLLAALDFGAQTMHRGIGIPVALVQTIEYLTVILIVGAGILRTYRFLPLERLLKRRRA